MLPAQPPSPADRNLRFQALVGIHTSKLMLESLVGLMMPATRHAAVSIGGVAPGGSNAPAGTTAATVMVVSGNCNEASASQAIGAASALDAATAANGSAASKALLDFMRSPLCVGVARLQSCIHRANRLSWLGQSGC